MTKEIEVEGDEKIEVEDDEKIEVEDDEKIEVEDDLVAPSVIFVDSPITFVTLAVIVVAPA